MRAVVEDETACVDRLSGKIGLSPLGYRVTSPIRKRPSP